jgi:hypothetical protein
MKDTSSGDILLEVKKPGFSGLGLKSMALSAKNGAVLEYWNEQKNNGSHGLKMSNVKVYPPSAAP